MSALTFYRTELGVLLNRISWKLSDFERENIYSKMDEIAFKIVKLFPNWYNEGKIKKVKYEDWV